ncbi:hypothetical protein [Bartonella doshiae]|uniref:UDP-3-O-[3-hydroxymyristoyl] glucosamine N-acyltransferase n=2 Tax=Bartonella doshiae TaxID=33044 RepID=A0A380ZFS9_BARDO|nr:hypothetical protein [Bartonella doshiae]EJF79631.1 hypothetical protein MCS_01358 [Bartonella doshiae NCTC 12862 = ATCC 700133]MBB6160086.1 hypothetical protein [Bartonella doshiae]SUV45400.1 Uncharacterised protein [Bartonella doshiae]
MQKKFALTNETRVFGNHTLYRIQALKDFADVKAGDLGGFIEKVDNLSHEGNCWVYNEALVFKNGHVYENAKVFGNAIVAGYVYGNAHVYGKAIIYDHAYVYDNARVYENARIANNVHVCENAHIHGIAVIRENVGGSTEIKTYIERLSPYGELEIVYVSPKIKQHN